MMVSIGRACVCAQYELTREITWMECLWMGGQPMDKEKKAVVIIHLQGRTRRSAPPAHTISAWLLNSDS